MFLIGVGDAGNPPAGKVLSGLFFPFVENGWWFPAGIKIVALPGFTSLFPNLTLEGVHGAADRGFRRA